MKSILLLTDFSKSASNAIRYAIQLFNNAPCTFYVLYAHKSTSYATADLLTSPSASIYKSILKKPKKKLREYVENLEAEYANNTTTFHALIDYDPLVAATNQLVDAKQIDLVVMGSNGATSAKEVIFGSNTLRVIRQVNCNTLIIPENTTYTPPTTIVLPLDEADSLAGKPMEDFLAFVHKYQLQVHVIRFNADPELAHYSDKDQEILNRLLPSENYIYQRIDTLSIDRIVSDYIQEHAIDLMSLFVQKESLLDRIFLGSPTTQLNKHTEIPLLIFHT